MALPEKLDFCAAIRFFLMELTTPSTCNPLKFFGEAIKLVEVLVRLST